MTMKKWIKIVSIVCSLTLSFGTLFGCNFGGPNSSDSVGTNSSVSAGNNSSNGSAGNNSENEPIVSVSPPVLDTATDLTNNKAEYFYGLGELTVETGTSLEANVTNEYVAKMAGVLGVKTQRVWMHVTNIIQRDPDNMSEYIINETRAEAFHDYFAKLKENGVERICALSHSFWQPYEYFYHADGCVPNPWNGEYDWYLRYLDEFETFYIMMQTEFPEVDYWEVHNEVNMLGTETLFPSYYTVGLASAYTNYQKAVLMMDMCWYANRGVKSVNPNAVIVLGGGIVYPGCGSWYSDAYEAINSKCLPTGQPFYDTNTNHYFEIMAMHPYPITHGHKKTVDALNEVYSVMTVYGDADKKMWLTESGYSHYEASAIAGGWTMEDIAEDYPVWLDLIKGLDYVETIFLFRLTNVTQHSDNAEGHFGLFYSPNDPENPGAPKPAAISIYQYQHGKDADLTPLYWYYNQKTDRN